MYMIMLFLFVFVFVFVVARCKCMPQPALCEFSGSAYSQSHKEDTGRPWTSPRAWRGVLLIRWVWFWELGVRDFLVLIVLESGLFSFDDYEDIYTIETTEIEQLKGPLPWTQMFKIGYMNCMPQLLNSKILAWIYISTATSHLHKFVVHLCCCSGWSGYQLVGGVITTRNWTASTLISRWCLSSALGTRSIKQNS